MGRILLLNRFSDYYAERLGPQVRYTISQDTQSILDLCGALKEESRHVRGLVFGFVQSGKTINYLSVANAAMGRGTTWLWFWQGRPTSWEGKLRNDWTRCYWSIEWQNRRRWEKEFKVEKSPLAWQRSVLISIRVAKAQMSGSLCTPSKRLLSPFWKECFSLKNLKKWLEQQAGEGTDMSILLIDDESDYASVNTKEEHALRHQQRDTRHPQCLLYQRTSRSRRRLSPTYWLITRKQWRARSTCFKELHLGVGSSKRTLGWKKHWAMDLLMSQELGFWFS